MSATRDPAERSDTIEHSDPAIAAVTTLGPLAVDGRPVRGDRLVALVRELIEARGRVVSTGALIEAVWQGGPPDDAAGALQALVSRVRRLGLSVEAGPGGYRVPAELLRVDTMTARGLADRSRAALRSGHAAAARAAADQARALFPDIPDLADAEHTRLFSDVVALRAEAALAGAGAFDESDLRRLAAHVPPDEPAAALLVRVLAAQGRVAEALDVVEQVRTELAERYGADPSPVLAGAHLAVLRGEVPGAGVPRPVAPSVLPPAWRRPATALLGREDDVAAVLAALATAPLVTVVATGGAGKTRLAGAVARRAPGPVRVVELAGLRSPDEVLPAVLAGCGGTDITAAGAGLPLERLALTPEERLRAIAPELDGLLVLDNCEHLLDATAAVVAELSAAAPELAVLATSRAPLALVGEVVHRLQMLPDAESLALLQARARAGGAVPTWDDERALALCHRLDNLPLALELAAARLRHMPIDDLLAGLDDRFTLLDDALRGLPDRHASLWAMVDWSRELLGAADRELLARLAVIPAPFTAELAAAVAATPDVRPGLANLVEQSLLSLESDGVTPRYRMLETVREYAEARLGDDAPAASDGLVRWARDEAVRLVRQYLGHDQLAAFARCATEQENLLAGLRRATARDDEVAVVEIAPALFHLWTVRGLHREASDRATGLLHGDEPAARLRSAITAGRAAGRPLPDADLLTWLCLLIGVNAGITGPARTGALARRALRLVLAERPEEISPSRRVLANALPGIQRLQPGSSTGGADELIACPDPYVRGLGLLLRATMWAHRGSSAAADPVADAEQAYRSFELAGDHWGMAMAAQTIGHSAGARGTGRATEWLARSVRHMELVGAAQDARSIGVLLDVQQALAGDQDAEKRLRDLTAAVRADHLDAVQAQLDLHDFDLVQAHLGLAHLAWQRADYDEVLAHGDAVSRASATRTDRLPQRQLLFQVAVAILYLRVAGARPETRPRTEAEAVRLLALVRDEAVSTRENPLAGAWALGGAELAMLRGAGETARELWSLGIRDGAVIALLFPPGEADRFAAPGDADQPTPPGDGRPGQRAAPDSRIRELMDGLLRKA
jgi:predicted ATPase/DNA-binding SARP family transcriptional activator